jgi:hypothetical protein
MPFDDARAVLNMPEGRRALLIGFNDFTPKAFERVRMRFVKQADVTTGCPMTPLANGLSRFKPSDDPACGYRHRIDRFNRTTFYRSTVLPPGLGPVELSCGNDPRIVGCRMTVRLPNDREAEVSLRKSMLDAWAPVAAAASDYFTANLVHCDRPPRQS